VKKILGAILIVTIITLTMVLPGPTVAHAQDDTTSPTTTLTFGHPGYEGWYPCGVEVTLNAADNEGGSGVAKTQYFIGNAIDPVPYWSDTVWDYMISAGYAHIYNEPFSVCWLGHTDETLFYRSVDNAGNNEEVKAELLKIDMSFPQIYLDTQTPTEPNDYGWYTEDLILTFSCSDAHSGIATCPAPVSVPEGWSQMVTVTAVDNVGFTQTRTLGPYHVDKTPPTITITTPGDGGLYPVGTTVTLNFSATDNIFWPQRWAYLNGQQVWNGYQVTDVGVYELVVQAKDAAGNETNETVTFIIYDPEGGFATGGGWISPDGESTLPGEEAAFGFVAKYKNGEYIGNLDFQYSNMEYTLKSTSIDWLAIAQNSAHFQGTGTINGDGLYTFRVTVEDEGEPGVGVDRFGIKIWEGTDYEADPIHKAKNVLAGGNIKIHKK